jgi:hypothetical protein
VQIFYDLAYTKTMKKLVIQPNRTQQTPPKGYHAEQQIPGSNEPAPNKMMFVKNGYKLQPCQGEAHENPHIDYCLRCLDYTWGWVPVKDEKKTTDE